MTALVSRRRMTRLALALFCGTLLWLTFKLLAQLYSLYVWIVVRPVRTVPLTAGLPGGWDAASEEFDRRMKASFPVGSAASQ